MPTITLSEDYDTKLKMLVMDPFEETRESIIEALIDVAVAHRGSTNGYRESEESADEVIRFDPDTPGNLAHSKVISATVNRRALIKPNWNAVRNHLHVLGVRRLKSFDVMRKHSGAALRTGRYEKDGFKYLREGDFSIQGVDSNWSWDHALQMARAIGVAIRVEFVWRDKDGAAYPGRRGVLEWDPSNS